MFASRSLRAISRPTSSIRSTPSTTSTSSVLLGARRWNSSDAAKQAEEEKINKAADKVDSAAEEVTKKVAELETQVKELKVRLCELELSDHLPVVYAER
jgi:predicted Rossmann fold nucleotide-binding protein DprA/Smf involved in DNA uptake